MGLLRTNNKGIKAQVYRGAVAQFSSPVDVNVQPIGTSTSPEPGLKGASYSGADIPTHTLIIGLPEDSNYQPMVDIDYIHVTGSKNGLYDGYYSLAEYAAPHVGFSGKRNHYTLKCRYTGAKKAGDVVGKDNSGRLRINRA